MDKLEMQRCLIMRSRLQQSLEKVSDHSPISYEYLVIINRLAERLFSEEWSLDDRFFPLEIAILAENSSTTTSWILGTDIPALKYEEDRIKT